MLVLRARPHGVPTKTISSWCLWAGPPTPLFGERRPLVRIFEGVREKSSRRERTNQGEAIPFGKRKGWALVGAALLLAMAH